jgi:hypothetical protein
MPPGLVPPQGSEKSNKYISVVQYTGGADQRASLSTAVRLRRHCGPATSRRSQRGRCPRSRGMTASRGSLRPRN